MDGEGEGDGDGTESEPTSLAVRKARASVLASLKPPFGRGGDKSDGRGGVV